MKASQLEYRLYQIASLQQGYFTARQAKEAGYADSRFSYHVKRGRWIREGRGIYRLANYPTGERADLVYWSLWSCNRRGEVQGVFSYQTALGIHDLSDVMPSSFHMTVPKHFRRFNKPPKYLRLHFEELQEKDILEFEGYKVTTPERTVHDILLDETVSGELVLQALSEGLQKGVVSIVFLNQLFDESQSARVKQIINTVLKK